MPVLPGQSYLICAFDPQMPPAFRQKLLSLGLLPGTRFRAGRIAPLGDPLEIHTASLTLMLRQSDLRLLMLEPCAGASGGAKP